MAVLMVVVLIWRPGGVVGGQEIGWPRRKKALPALEDVTEEASAA
jgi:hypothetical protein